MSDTVETEMVEQPEGETPKAVTLEDIKGELERTAAALKKANAEAAKYRHAASKHQEELEAKRQAEMTEMEKLQEALKASTSELAAIKAREMKRAIAARVGLPDALALRLQGETEDELVADAEALKETLPKAAPGAPAIPASNPGSQATPPKLTDAQMRARLYGAGGDIYDPSWAAQHGGGVLFIDKD